MKLKTIFAGMLGLMAGPAFATEAVLLSYKVNTPFQYASYSLRLQSSDPTVTRNHQELIYQPGEVFQVGSVVTDFGTIADLGETSCSAIPNRYEQQGTYPGRGHGGYPYKEDRVQDPMFWISYTDAWSNLSDSMHSSRVGAKQGHCYIVHVSEDEGRLVAMFHVKEVQPDIVYIDEIEVFSK